MGSARGQPGLAEVGLLWPEKSVAVPQTPKLPFVLEERPTSSHPRDERLRENCFRENTCFKPLNLPVVSQTKLQSRHIMARERVSLTASELLAGLTLGKTQIFDPTIFLRTIENCGKDSVIVLSAVTAPLRTNSCVPLVDTGEEMNTATQRL